MFFVGRLAAREYSKKVVLNGFLYLQIVFSASFFVVEFKKTYLLYVRPAPIQVVSEC